MVPWRVEGTVEPGVGWGLPGRQDSRAPAHSHLRMPQSEGS